MLGLYFVPGAPPERQPMGCTEFQLLMTSIDWWGKNEGQTHQGL